MMFAGFFVVAIHEDYLKVIFVSMIKHDRFQSHFVWAFCQICPRTCLLYHQGESSTKIKVVQGRDEYLKIFNASVEESREEIKFFGSADDFIQFVSWKTENEWIKKRLKNNIFMKTLLLPGEDAKTLREADEWELRETRILTDTKHFSASFMLFSNKLIFWQPKVPLALQIDDEYITETMQIVFEKMWTAAKL